MFVTNWISTTKIQKISEITNFFRHYFLSRTEVVVQPLERSFQLGYVPEKLPFLLGVPLPWAPPKGQTPAVFRYA